jgi:hypothetical protein
MLARGGSFGDQGGNLNGRQPDARIADGNRVKQEKTSFLKKRSKKLLLIWARGVGNFCPGFSVRTRDGPYLGHGGYSRRVGRQNDA